MQIKALLTLSFLLCAVNAFALDLPGIKAMMQGLEKDMNQAQSALLKQDGPALAAAAQAIAHHPVASEAERKAIQGVLKQEMGKFKEWDHKTHEAASTLAQAAETSDYAAQAVAYQQMLQGCLGCHQDFRQRLLK